MSHDEIVAFAREHDLPADLVGALEALIARLSSTTLAPTVSPDPGPREAPAPPVGVAGVPSRYEDLGPLGVGGMGEVRRVRDRELGRTLAYKVVRAELAGRTTIEARFVEEAQVAAQLQHPNVPPVYDAGRLADGRPWFSMEEVRGRTLTALIREAHGGPPPGDMGEGGRVLVGWWVAQQALAGSVDLRWGPVGRVRAVFSHVAYGGVSPVRLGAGGRVL